MSHAPSRADKLLIKPAAGARPAPPCHPDRSLRRHATRPVTRRVTSSTETPGWRRPQTDRLNRISQSPDGHLERGGANPPPPSYLLTRVLGEPCRCAVSRPCPWRPTPPRRTGLASCLSRPASAWRCRLATRSTHRARRSSCRSAASSGPSGSTVPGLGDGVVQQRHIALAGMPLHPLAV